MTSILAAIGFLGVPALILWACVRWPFAARLEPIVLCYAAGLLVGLTGLLPDSVAPARTGVAEASIGLALPLLLFAVDLGAWRHLAGRALLSMALAVTAVVAVSVALHVLFAARGTEAPEQLAGMAVGMYTGGIANVSAIKMALGVPDARYLLFATADTAVGALYVFFIIAAAPAFFRRLLPAFPKAEQEAYAHDALPAALPRGRRAVLPGLVALAAAAACVGLALAVAPLLTFMAREIAIIVLITTFGIAGSLIRPLRENPMATPLGMFLIYVFSFAIAASLDLKALAGMDPSILVFVFVATFGSLALHALLCRLFNIDADTFVITSVAAILSPAFVPMAARALRNSAVLMSGMTTGIIGFAIGNYLGIAVALLLARGG
ncbi:MAG: DUF819 family protein [Aquamicrobium sp.]|uniref:DUF819 family protein n=1 Tax=Aquamicrobium sp. TaxID=1872579 RepID=UPI00349EC229|nr:DUF819 family protein [Aquamicrobium sp.]